MLMFNIIFIIICIALIFMIIINKMSQFDIIFVIIYIATLFTIIMFAIMICNYFKFTNLISIWFVTTIIILSINEVLSCIKMINQSHDPNLTSEKITV